MITSVKKDDFMRALSIAMILMFTSPFIEAQSLSLQDYLTQVQKQNQAYQGAQSQAQGSEGLSREADLLYSTTFFAEARSGYDEKLPNPPTITYDRANSSLYSLGLSKQFAAGLNAKLSYSMSNTELEGATLPSGTENQFADGTAQLELALPLLANGFGRSVRANEVLLREQALASKFSALSQAQNILAQAETAYWRLAAAQEQLEIDEQSLKAAQSIQSYVKAQSRRDLNEPADVVQSNALVEGYALQVQQSQSARRAAEQDFNFYLNKSPTEGIPTLEKLNIEKIAGIEVPALRPGDRYDVQASAAQTRLAQANSVVAQERNKPNLDLYAAYSSYGSDSEMQEAYNKSLKSERDGAYIGVRFSMPLNMTALSEARRGAEYARSASEKNLSALKYQQEKEWVSLVDNLNDAKRTLKLTEIFEKTQRAKLEMERTRLRQGRTTTYQVLLFEQDYNKAQSSRLQIAAQILQLQSQAKLYQAQLESEK